MDTQMLKEIDEAILAGNNALYHLTEAENTLKNASNWGIADIIGGGFFISMIKRNKMAEARTQMAAAKEALEDMVREIRDLDIYFKLDIDTDDFLDFADMFFDNFMDDLMAQSKISNARSQVGRAIDEVEEVLDTLGELREEYACTE
jgi:predicted translin family RNA/ssDNA-binding protein